MLIQHMSLDVKQLEDLRAELALFRSSQSDEGNRQVVDAMISIIDEELEVLEGEYD